MIDYEKDYPRPQLRRNNWINLNGRWNFIFDDKNEGENLKYYMSFPTALDIIVPFTYETKLSGIQDEKVHENIWYNRKISFDCKDNKKIVLLHFEACDYITKLWVNGIFVGENVGGYTRFSFEIQDYLLDGENDITVKVEDSLSKNQVRGKQRCKKESYTCFYIQTTGIWKTVWLEYVPYNYIKSIKTTPVLDTKKVSFDIDLNTSIDLEGYSIKTNILYKSNIVNSNIMKIYDRYMCIKMDIITKDILHTWSPKDPSLYDVECKLYYNDILIDEVSSYFGVREILIKGDNIYLNKEPLYLKFILDQGYWKDSHLTPPNEESLIYDIDIALKYGYNGVRKHQKIEDERFLYWCDKKGLLVWSEMPSFFEFSDYAIEHFTYEWIKAVKQNYNHPSIITWVPINESWGIPTVKTNDKEKQFINSIYYLTKSIDSTRPVITNDGWEHTISDIITLHDYRESGNELFDIYSNDKEKLLNSEIEYNSKHALFADGYSYNGQPIIISEYGGIALDSNKQGWGYGNKVNSEIDFYKRFEEITNAIQKLPWVCGYCYTQLTDVQQEINGIVDEERSKKLDEELLYKINNSKLQQKVQTFAKSIE